MLDSQPETLEIVRDGQGEYYSPVIKQGSVEITLNPADLPTRGKYGKDLPSNKLWRDGPEFLKKSRDHWLENLSTSDVDQSVALQEQIKNLPSITH